MDHRSAWTRSKKLGDERECDLWEVIRSQRWLIGCMMFGGVEFKTPTRPLRQKSTILCMMQSPTEIFSEW